MKADIVNRLRDWAATICMVRGMGADVPASKPRMALEAADEIERLRAERDEARREVCELRCNPPERFIGLPHELAKVNGWTCFPEGKP